ncbi:hypothetical protein A9Q75_15520 [Colwellia psychrerythraea]|uniref:YqhA family protein n=1 Tax=Colwellia psychrerythraea TaxID=28229 RepID=A0A1Y5E2X8_COLPS|nr:hypothetical protein A9Q75_15520 [Colwellia psychrerythraea]
MEKLFEEILWKSRLILIVAVICCVVTAASFVILGVFEVIHLIEGLFSYLVMHSEDVSRDSLVLTVIEILDTFLISSILFIFSFGLYELFISPIESSRELTSQAFQIKSIEELKAKLGKVIVMLLVIKVFAHLVELKPSSMLEMLYLAIIVLLVSISLWLGHDKSH